MNAEKFIPNITWIGDHIVACKTPVQLKYMHDFYHMVVSKEWYPEVSEHSINEALKTLNKLYNDQDLKINKKEND